MSNNVMTSEMWQVNIQRIVMSENERRITNCQIIPTNPKKSYWPLQSYSYCSWQNEICQSLIFIFLVIFSTDSYKLSFYQRLFIQANSKVIVATQSCLAIYNNNIIMSFHEIFRASNHQLLNRVRAISYRTCNRLIGSANL